ncbi:MAG: exosortase [Terriglobales bacterium]
MATTLPPTTDTAPSAASRGWLRRLLRLREAWFAAVALVLVYASVAVKLIDQWSYDPNYSHGFLIPFAIVFFLWHKRARLAALPTRPAKLGVALIVYSQAQYLLGILGAELFLQRTSFLFLAAGVVALLWGWAHLRAVSFEFVLALVAIPLPAILFNEVAFPLQLIASQWAAVLLTLTGVPVFRQGNVLQLPFRALDVAEACSGIRSLFSLFALALMVAYFLPVRRWVKWAFVFSAVPIALIANAIRIAVTGLLGQYVGQEYATGFFHEFSGWVIFLIAFILLLGEAALVQRWSKRPLPAAREGSSA